MATLPQANKAREDHSTWLRDLGAHSIGVEKVHVKGNKTFAVVAYLTEASSTLPDALEIDWKDKKKKVPLVTKIAGTFKPE